MRADAKSQIEYNFVYHGTNRLATTAITFAVSVGSIGFPFKRRVAGISGDSEPDSSLSDAAIFSNCKRRMQLEKERKWFRPTVREPIQHFKGGGAVLAQDQPFLNHKMTNRRGQAHLQACLAACIELLCPAPRSFPTSSFGNSSSHPPPQVSSYDARRGCREGTFFLSNFCALQYRPAEMA